MSASAFFFSGSSTNTHCQPWELEPVGACSARSRHSISTSRGTGFSRSSRLRTERVVVRTSSAERLRVTARDYIRRYGSRIHARGDQQARIRPVRVADDRGQIRPVPRLVWFYFDGKDIVVYSMPNAAKVRHITNHPRVSVNLDSDGNGAGIIVVVGGEATVDATDVD